MQVLRLARRFATYDFDLAVIGSGPGGYVAAIKAAQLGLKTACIEKKETLGGTCLNVGCIPAKALLNSTHKLYDAQNHFAAHGVIVEKVRPDLKQMMLAKDKAVKALTKGVEGLFRKNSVTWVKGAAAFKDPHTLAIAGGKTVTANHFIIATGSESSQLPGGILRIDESRVLSSTGAMALTEIPKRMVVIGGGVIGLELGSVWARLGTEVKVVEFLPRILPGADLEMANTLQKLLSKQGLQFHLGAKVVGGRISASGVSLSIEKATADSKDVPSTLETDYVLVAVGRRAYTEGLGLDTLGVTLDKAGRVEVNDHLQTQKHAHIYAIGDCIKGPMLAHKAEDEGIYAAELIAKKGGHVNYDAIPSVVYTHPELAGVGKTEEELKALQIPYTKGVFPFLANSRAKANSVYLT
jgi:dihydrolipoamide dehydrogenase